MEKSYKIKYYDYIVVDAFTKLPLSGNPVAVFKNALGLSSQDMQRIARELNLSETTFVFPAQSDGDYHVRIFTPVNELPFAGHPILGTAFVLGAGTTSTFIRLETGMGTIPLVLQRSKQGGLESVQMTQPVPIWSAYEFEPDVLKALDLQAAELPIDLYENGPRHVLVGVKNVATLSAIKPDLRILAELPNVAINCFAGDGVEWHLRMFSPAYGVSEDAATGSAAGPLALHLIRYGRLNFGQQIEISQGVEIGRPSLMYAKVDGTLEHIGPIQVSGHAVIISHNRLIRW